MSPADFGNNGANQDGRDLSFIIEASGRIVPVLPDGNEFSPGNMHEYLAGPPELLCRTDDGFFLFRNRESETCGLPVNQLASARYLKPSQQLHSLMGRILLVHPDHIASYMKTR